MDIGPSIAAIILAATYVVSGLARFGETRHENQWISAAAGVTLAYVFIDLLPALARRQAIFAAAKHPLALFPEDRIYIAALLGFLTFYTLEHMTLLSRDSVSEGEPQSCYLACWLDTVGFAFYSGLVAYFLNRWVRPETLVFYTIAMALHFFVVSHSLREEQGEIYSRKTSYILAGSVLAGWGLGLAGIIPEPVLDTLVGFIAGGVVINSITKEMPKEGEARFKAFVLGALGYAALLLLAE
jgi:hypothetical protein